MQSLTTHMDVFFDTIGLIGMMCILLAYFMQQLGRWAPNHLPYLITNIIGAGLLLISLLWSWNLASFVLECAWLSISFYGVYRYQKAKKQGAKL